MMCKDCIHYEPCIFHADGNKADKCRNFKNKADVVEVKHGEWIYEEDVIGETDTGQYRCSNCRAGDIHLKKIDVPFCWKCGAKMDGKGG